MQVKCGLEYFVGENFGQRRIQEKVHHPPTYLVILYLFLSQLAIPERQVDVLRVNNLELM